MNPGDPRTISSLIVTLSPDPTLRASALEHLQRSPELELGLLQGAWLPAVLDSADPTAAVYALEALPGVVLVEIVFVEIAA